MRALILTALGLVLPCYCIEKPYDELINPFTRHIYYRYYLVKRCEESIDLLIQNKNIWNQIDARHIAIDKIENPEIKDKVAIIQETHAIIPLIDLWHQMKTHRHLDDASFERDFIKLMFMLYKSIEIPSQKRLYHSITEYSLETVLKSIDATVNVLKAPSEATKNAEYHIGNTTQISTDDIAFNYYLIQRLDKSLRVLAKEQAAVSQEDSVACATDVMFSHDRVNYCLSQMLIRKNIQPLLHMWQEFSHFRHTGDNHFLKEMLMMLFAVYKDLLLTKLSLSAESEQVITSEMNTILDLYEHINELPLDEILQAIDLTTDKLLLLQNMDKKTKVQWGARYPIVFHMLLALPVAYIIIKLCAL